MLKNDPTIHISGDADLALSRLQFEARQKNKRISKQDLASFIIDHCCRMKEFEPIFWKWVDKNSVIIRRIQNEPMLKADPPKKYSGFVDSLCRNLFFGKWWHKKSVDKYVQNW